MNKKMLILSLLFIAIGLAGTVNIVINGEHAMGTSNGVPWGSLIAGYEYFVGISTGLMLVTALGYVFNVKAFLPMAKNAVILAIFTMFSAFALLFVELGNVFHMFWYFITPNFGSPIWWMAPLYSIYLIMLILLLVNILKENQKKIKLYSTLAFVAAIISLGNIGFLFGFLQARPYWQGPFTPVYFVISAFFSGLAVLSFVTFLSNKQNEATKAAILAFRNLLLIMIAVISFFYISKFATGLFGAASGKYEAVKAIVAGPLSFNFWVFEVLTGLVIPLFLLIKTDKPRNIGYAGLFATIGIFFMRLDMVIAGQITPLKVVYGGVKELIYHSYTPTWAEWSVILGGIGISLLLYGYKDMVEVKVMDIGKGTNRVISH